MRYLHTIIERGLLFLFVLSFSFVSLYVPQLFTEVQTVEAGGGFTGEATLPMQIVQDVNLGAINGFSSVSAGADTITSSMTAGSFAIDNVLDGIAWSLAKKILSEMTSSILNWVNSGFKGSPAFVTDMRGFLLDIADREIGNYLEDLGGPLSFICAPFKLDVQIAVSLAYENSRNNAGMEMPGTCTLTGALANLDKFIDGTESFVDGGGWDTWFAITSNPNQYTPYGTLLTAKAQATARIVNARGEEIKLLEFGDGFLSAKVCEKVEDESGGHEKCGITTPGKVINEALTFQTSAGPRSLIEADEINEIISAVFSQLTQKAITGTMGLLGLSGGTGYTYAGVPFTSQLSTSALTSNPDQLRQLISDAYDTEMNYRILAEYYEPLLLAYATDITKPAERRREAQAEYSKVGLLISDIIDNANALNDLLITFDAMTTPNPTTLQEISATYFGLDLHSPGEVSGNENLWKTLIK
jgi:hypothetical protein